MASLVVPNRLDNFPEARIGCQVPVIYGNLSPDLVIAPDKLTAVADLIPTQFLGNSLSCIGLDSPHQVME